MLIFRIHATVVGRLDKMVLLRVGFAIQGCPNSELTNAANVG